MHEESGAPLLLYQVIVPEGGHYLIVQAMVAAGRSETFLPRFRQATQAIRRER